MRTKKVGKQKEKINSKDPKNTMDLLKNELYNIIREEDETKEKVKKRARKNHSSYRQLKERELFATMNNITRTVKDLEISIDCATKLIEDIASVNKGIIRSESSEEVENITIDGRINFSGESYSIGSLVEKLRTKYNDNQFTASMSRSELFTSKKRPVKGVWIDFLEDLVKEKILKRSHGNTSKTQIRYQF